MTNRTTVVIFIWRGCEWDAFTKCRMPVVPRANPSFNIIPNHQIFFQSKAFFYLSSFRVHIWPLLRFPEPPGGRPRPTLSVPFSEGEFLLGHRQADGPGVIVEFEFPPHSVWLVVSEGRGLSINETRQILRGRIVNIDSRIDTKFAFIRQSSQLLSKQVRRRCDVTFARLQEVSKDACLNDIWPQQGDVISWFVVFVLGMFELHVDDPLLFRKRIKFGGWKRLSNRVSMPRTKYQTPKTMMHQLISVPLFPCLELVTQLDKPFLPSKAFSISLNRTKLPANPI